MNLGDPLGEDLVGVLPLGAGRQGEGLTGRFAVRNLQAGSGIRGVGEAAGSAVGVQAAFEALRQTGFAPRPGVVHRARHRRTGQRQPAAPRSDDLNVEPAGVPLARVHAGGEGVLAPVAGRDQEAVHAYGRAQVPLGGPVGGGCEDGGDDRHQPGDQPGNGRLGAAEQLGDQRLGRVVAQVQQYGQDRAVWADCAAAGRIEATGGVDVEHEPVDLIAGQARHSLYPRRPVGED